MEERRGGGMVDTLDSKSNGSNTVRVQIPPSAHHLFASRYMNKFLDNFLRKTAWMWLPFYALWVLTHKLIERYDKK